MDFLRSETFVEQIEAMWATRFSRWERPDVSREVDHVLSYFEHVLYDVVGDFTHHFDRAYEHYSGHVAPSEDGPRLSFGSWVGGDMDGNPYVIPAVFKEALTKQHHAIIALYAAELERIAPHLTHSSDKVPLSPELAATAVRRRIAQ